MIEYSQVFKKSIEAVPRILGRRLGMPEKGRSQLDSVFFTSRDAIIKSISQSGNPAEVVPFIGMKITSIYVDPDSYNNHAMKREGLTLSRGDGFVYLFFGRPVIVEAECLLFSNSFDEIISTVQQILFLSSELHFNMKLEEGEIEVRISIDKEGISIPEADFQSQISTFEFSFPVKIKTYAGVIEKVDTVTSVKVQGGPVVTYVMDEKIIRRVDRAIGLARGVNPDAPNTIIDLEIGLNQDVIDRNNPLVSE
jgi:hypothetical protein